MPTAVALIVAAGRGRRLGAPLPKQYLDLAGRPILARVLAAFDRAACIERLVLVLPAQDIVRCRDELIAPLGLQTPLVVTAGGDERQDSVRNGLAALDDLPGDAVVAIHDGVRPFLDPGLLSRCIDTAARCGSCIPVLPLVDTVKALDAAGRVVGSPDRGRLFAAQTPQVFCLALIREAHAAAAGGRSRYATDDAALVEALGRPVETTAGHRWNIKITTTEDLDLARALLAAGLWRDPA